MDQAELVSRLVAASAAERAALLERHDSRAGVELAQALKATYFDTYSSDPQRAAAAAAALTALASTNDHPVVAWTTRWWRQAFRIRTLSSGPTRPCRRSAS